MLVKHGSYRCLPMKFKQDLTTIPINDYKKIF